MAATASRRLREASKDSLDFTIITGLSGAGRSEAAKSLEDLGYFVVDNLPPALIGRMAELVVQVESPSRVAIVADVRGGVLAQAGDRPVRDPQILHAVDAARRIQDPTAADAERARHGPSGSP